MEKANKLAKLLVDYSLDVQPKQIIGVVGNTISEPLVVELYKEILKKGAYPVVDIGFQGQDYLMYKYSNDDQLSFLTPMIKSRAENINGLIRIDCSYNSKELTQVDPSKIALKRKSSASLRDILDERESKGEYKWVIAPYPTNSFAQDLEMSLEETNRFVCDACGLRYDDPVLYWKDRSEMQKQYLNLLQGTKKLQIIQGNTNLTFNTEGRKYVNCDGHCNMPDGEIFTSPVENGVDGEIYFDLITCYNGVEVEGVYLKIVKGVIIEAKARKGEDFLHKMINMDEGSKYIGEVAFGLNENITRISKEILFDEKMGKTFHIAIGASYPETGGKNKSSLHWDMIKKIDENSVVYADNKVIYKDGKFIL